MHTLQCFGMGAPGELTATALSGRRAGQKPSPGRGRPTASELNALKELLSDPWFFPLLKWVWSGERVWICQVLMVAPGCCQVLGQFKFCGYF